MKLKSAVISILLLIILTFLYMWPFTKQPKIVETKTFFCQGMEGFMFEYPVFEEWEVKVGELSGPVGCVLTYSKSSEVTKVVVKKLSAESFVKKMSYKTNPHEIMYLPKFGNENIYVFLPVQPSFAIEFTVTGNSSFSKDPFFKTVIDSFRLSHVSAILKLNSTISILPALRISLSKIDRPTTNVPGNRPLYHLIFTDENTKNKTNESYIFDPLNSGKTVEYGEYIFVIKTNSVDSDSLLVTY